MTGETYEKVYTKDSYKEVFASFHDRYSAQAEQALQGREIDRSPMPNATTVIYLNDGPSGDVTISGTGDFIKYFNSRYGTDRIGQTRRSLEHAARKAEIAQRQAEQEKRKKEAACRLTHAKPRFAFVQCLFALMMVLSFALFGFTSLLLQKTDERIDSVSAEIAVLEMSKGDGASAMAKSTEPAKPSYVVLDGEDSVECYPVEKSAPAFAALLDALSNLGR